MKTITETTPDGTEYSALHGRVTVTVSTEYMERAEYQNLSNPGFRRSSAFDFCGPNGKKFNELLLCELLNAYHYGVKVGRKESVNTALTDAAKKGKEI